MPLKYAAMVLFYKVRTKQELPAFSPREGQFSTSGEVPSFYTSPHIFKVVPFAQYRNSILSGAFSSISLS